MKDETIQSVRYHLMEDTQMQFLQQHLSDGIVTEMCSQLHKAVEIAQGCVHFTGWFLKKSHHFL